MAKPASYYDEAYYDTDPTKGYPGPYTVHSAPWDRLARALVLTFGPSLGTTTCADFGCARGFVIGFLKGMYGWTVKGYDFSKYAVKSALPGLDIEVADLTRTKPFDPVDLVLCMDTLEHIDEARLPKAIQNLRAATKKVAVFHVLTPNGKDPSSHHNAEDHATIADHDWWQAMFEANGFRRHFLEAQYKVNVKILAKGIAGQIWAENAYVLEPVPLAVAEPIVEAPVEEAIAVPWPMNAMEGVVP